MSIDIVSLGRFVDDAARNATAIPQLSETAPITLDQAYAVQAASLDRRFVRGERLIGMKMGFTSKAKMIQMGVSDMICGRLTDAMLVEDGGSISIKEFVHPRVEPEIAFILKKRLSGRVTPSQAMLAVDAVAPAMEIIDSRYQNFKFSLEDVVADNSSSSGFVIGCYYTPDTEIANLGMVLNIDGKEVAHGSTAAILGHPARSLAAASRLADQYGITLEAGSIVLAGGATAAYALQPGTSVILHTQGMSSCGFSVEV